MASGLSDRYIVALSEADEQPRVGGKAWRLCRMLSSAFPVPTGFVVTDDAFRFTAQHERPSEDSTIPVQQPLDEPFRRMLAQSFVAFLRNKTAIVRSSAIGEDGTAASYAGILDSVRDVTEPEDLERALTACWASLWGERSLTYQKARGVRLQGMAVLVQEQIRSSMSGIVFTRAPVAVQEREALVGEYCNGPGDGLVSGSVEPGRFVVGRGDLRVVEHASPPEGGAALSPEHLRRIARLCLDVEQLFGAPQDIEWTIDPQGFVFLVQSRPITTGLVTTKRIVWSNANVSENFPEPVTTFVYSVASTGYEHYFRNLAHAFGVPKRRVRGADGSFRQIIGAPGGRIYYNLTHIHRVLRTVPFGEWLTRSFDAFVGVNRTSGDDGDESREAVRPLRDVAALAFMAVKTTWLCLGLRRKVTEFEATADTYAQEWTAVRIAQASTRELLEALSGFVEIRSHRWLGASLADAAAMVTSGMSRALVGAAEWRDLLKARTDLVSTGPALALWDLSDRIRADPTLVTLFRDGSGYEIWQALSREAGLDPFRKDVEDYLERWGFRSSGELMMTYPSFQEQPNRLLDLLKAYVTSRARSPRRAFAAEVQRCVRAETAVETRLRRDALHRFLPFLNKAQLFRPLMRWTHDSIALRERARLKQALLYTRCRQVVLAIGKSLTERAVTESAEDAFFLTWQECVRLLSGRELFPELVRDLVGFRRREYERTSGMALPDQFVANEGSDWDTAAAPAEGRPRPVEAVRWLPGVAAGRGRVRGPAAVLRHVSNGTQLSGDEVLVAPQTDPGWGPLFPLISGLVLERGGLLSHGAILAREFGIPSVVGVKDATRIIEDGRYLEVDGDRGHVLVLG